MRAREKAQRRKSEEQQPSQHPRARCRGMEAMRERKRARGAWRERENGAASARTARRRLPPSLSPRFTTSRREPDYYSTPHAHSTEEASLPARSDSTTHVTTSDISDSASARLIDTLNCRQVFTLSSHVDMPLMLTLSHRPARRFDFAACS